METTCEYCGKTFEKEERQVKESIKNGWKQYCSKECAHKARNTKIKCNCAQCGKEILKQPHEIRNSKNGNVFCSKSCACSYNNSHFRIGENNPNWINGSFIKSKYAKIAYRTYYPECCICGCDDKDMLDVHHIDFNRDNSDVNNLIILCANHHAKVHRGGLEITQDIKDSRKLLEENK